MVTARASKLARGLVKLDKIFAALHQQGMRGERKDLLRQALGGKPVANQTVSRRDAAVERAG